MQKLACLFLKRNKYVVNLFVVSSRLVSLPLPLLLLLPLLFIMGLFITV